MMSRKFSWMAAAAGAAVLMFSGVPMAQAESVEDKLVAAVKALSEEQQTALYHLLQTMTAEAPDEADLEAQATAAFQAFVDAANEGDLDAMVAFFSEDFQFYQIGDKRDMHAFLAQTHAMGFLDQIEFDMDGVEFTERGDTVRLYPVEVQGMFGRATFEFDVKQEDGEWRVVGLDVSGL